MKTHLAEIHRNGSTISFSETDELAAATFGTHSGNKQVNRSYARRIVACLRAFDGVPTEQIEAAKKGQS